MANNIDSLEKISSDRLTPKWLRDLLRLSLIRPQFIFSGNIRDKYLVPDEDSYAIKNFKESLWLGLQALQFDFLVTYDPIDGISLFPQPEDIEPEIKKALGIKLTDNAMPVSLDSLIVIMRKIVNNKEKRIAIVLDYASRILRSHDQLDEAQHKFYVGCEKLSQDATRSYIHDVRLFNPIIWLANDEEDLAEWYAPDNDVIHSIQIGKPNYDQRMQVALSRLNFFKGYDASDSEKMEFYAKVFADMTDQLSIRDMDDVAVLAHANNMCINDVDDAVRSFKVGDPALDNPWISKNIRDKISNAEEKISQRVVGQQKAVKHAMGILKRSAAGLTGAHVKSSSNRPRGVMFLAGPTGVGKTELAKALTETIFGDENAYIRFDMSEYSAEHADQKLIGSPPGYVGHAEGGQLTNKVRDRPFSLILFDEIEKAHPKILDKFLQILEDGRITSGKGETVYFSESIIVFTSNKGIVGTKPDGSTGLIVDPKDPYLKIEQDVKSALKNFFTNELERPELLNRLGENIVVFDFIRNEAAEKIFDGMVDNIAQRIEEKYHGVLKIEDEARKTLFAWTTENVWQMGGRGIGNLLESRLTTPLSDAITKIGLEYCSQITITSVSETNGNYSVSIDCENSN